MNVSLVTLADAEELDDYLSAMNESGQHPDLPFIDANGRANIAHGMAPSGDDWAVGYEVPRDPDTGTEHCCQCADHRPTDCWVGATWEPTFPIVAITAHPNQQVCACTQYVIDYSDPERYHPENLETDDSQCPIHGPNQQIGEFLCDGCRVREPWEHRCHGGHCPCGECREERALFEYATFMQAIREAEERSAHVCEECGQPGELRTERRWIRTLCDTHDTPEEMP